MDEKLIRRYVRSVLSEMAYEDVKTSNDPTDWVEAAFQDPEDWDTDDPYKAMIRAARKFGLEEFGMGSSRFVFAMDSGKVLKIARNKKGVEQNKLEAFAGRDPHVHSMLASVYDSSPENAWLVSEFVEPLDDLDFKVAESVAGVSWEEVRKVLGLSSKTDAKVTAKAGDSETATKKLSIPRGHAGKRPSGSGCLAGDKFLEGLKGFLDRYQGMLTGDIVKLSSWGVSGKGCLVLLDYGITRKKFEELYK